MQWRQNRLGVDSSLSIEILDLQDILSRMTVPHTPALKIKFDGTVIERTDAATGKKSITGYVSADTLVRLAKEHRETLFLENPRQALGKAAPTYRAILYTLSEKSTRQRFWKLNNGITAICTGFTAEPNSYMVENFKIVNGRQTAYTLEESTHPIDDVFLLMIIHETVDDDERNQISETTNTQNPIKPVDLITNYPEMIELALQCKRLYPKFYFERQTKGFASAKHTTQVRVTGRRVMEKNSVARSYYAYAIDPNGATMPEKVLFFTGSGSGYDAVFADHDIKDLIIPHIFMQSLAELHRRWCKELQNDPSDELSRNKGIISKDVVRYYILRFIYETMMEIDGERRNTIKDTMIESFGGLIGADPIPERFLDVAQSAYDTFMFCFDMNRSETWPKDLLRKINSNGYREQQDDVPSPYDMADALKKNGDRLLPHMLRMRRHMMRQVGDKVAAGLLKHDSSSG